MPQIFYRHIYKEKNFLYLNGKNMLQPKVLEIKTDFLQEDENNYKQLRNNLPSYKNIFQYIYWNVFPEIYCSTEKHGFDLKSNLVQEKEVKERVEKQKQKLREVAEKKKDLKKNNKKGNQEQSKVKEKKMWKCLGGLKKKFNEMNKSKKDSKKCLKI